MRAAGQKYFGRIIQREFTKQAKKFSQSQAMREKGGLGILPLLAEVKPTDRVLDIACGPGFVAMEFAKHTREVVGVDLTTEMLKKARALARREGLNNVTFRRADVNHLPFSNASFDVVVTRASFHHFPHPDRVLAEMVRVLKNKGKILISDNTSKNDPAKNRLHNLIERLRDPSHVETLPLRKWRALFKNAGLRVVKEKRLIQPRNAEDWMELTQTPPTVRQKIHRLFTQSMRGDKTGQNVRVVNGEVVFDMNYRIFILDPGEM
ncbi:MAG: class I SAM-dependent methyltransferase [Deltaproteobacteria bacterium]|nr:MAG: class I SAM-dependent methyltransferase [Deltaproteobacteria bacterium]